MVYWTAGKRMIKRAGTTIYYNYNSISIKYRIQYTLNLNLNVYSDTVTNSHYCAPQMLQKQTELWPTKTLQKCLATPNQNCPFGLPSDSSLREPKYFCSNNTLLDSYRTLILNFQHCNCMRR